MPAPKRPAVQTKGPEHTNARPAIQLSYDQWWAQYSAGKKLNPALKTALAMHMKARGFYQRQQWAAGAADFGMKP